MEEESSRRRNPYQELKPPIKHFKTPDRLTPAQIMYWKMLCDREEFINANSFREQLGITVKELNVNADSSYRWSQNSIGELFGMSRSNVIKQYNKYKNGVQKIGAPTILTLSEQTHLSKWLNEQLTLKEYPTLETIADYIMVHFKKDILLNTLRKFIADHMTSYKFIDATPIEDVRFDVEPKDIDAYYDLLEKHISLVDFRFFFNLDETGEDEYIDIHTIKVLVNVTTDPDTVKLPVSRKQKRFTIIHTICTDGTYTNMYIIIPRVTVESDLYTLIDINRFRIVYQKNGFVTNDVFKDFWSYFISQLREKRKKYSYTGLSIVTMDNHRSHRVTVGSKHDEKVTFVPEENLLVIWLVPHASDQIQPLDLGIFAVQKRETQKQKKGQKVYSIH